MCGQKRWLLTFSLHCLCSSTSHLFTSLLRLVYWSTLKIANDLPIYFCILLCICYCFSHLIGLLSVTWLPLLYKFTRFFIYFLFLSDEGQMLETLDFTIRIGSTPNVSYFDLYLYSSCQQTTFITTKVFAWSQIYTWLPLKIANKYCQATCSKLRAKILNIHVRPKIGNRITTARNEVLKDT